MIKFKENILKENRETYLDGYKIEFNEKEGTYKVYDTYGKYLFNCIDIEQAKFRIQQEHDSEAEYFKWQEDVENEK